MSDQTTIFEATPAETPAEPTPSVEPTATPDTYGNLLSGITDSEGRQKYSDVEKALSSITPAQEHISNLENELDELRGELASRQTADEVLKEIQNGPTAVTPAKTDAVDPRQITDIVNNALQEREAHNAIETNQSKVATELELNYGDKAESVYLAKARDLGMTPSQINALAGTSPAAVLSWFKQTPEVTPPKTMPTVNSQSLAAPAPSEYKSVMGASSTAEIVSAWRKSGERVTNS